MQSLIRPLMLLLTVLVLVGCEPGSTPVEAPDTSVNDLIINDLKMTAENGALGSEMGSIQENLEKLRATDAAKADELMKDLEELESMSDAAGVTKKANEMIGKLGA